MEETGNTRPGGRPTAPRHDESNRPETTVVRPRPGEGRPSAFPEVNVEGSGTVERSGSMERSGSVERTRAPTGGRARALAKTQVGGAPSADRRGESAEARQEDLRDKEEARLRRPDFVNQVVLKLPEHSPARQFIEAFVDSFASQLVVALTVTAALVAVFHVVDPMARIAPPLFYIWFLASSLYFARFRPIQAVSAACALILTGVVLFGVTTTSGAGAKPLLAFKPTLLFWVSIGVITVIGNSVQNRHVEALLTTRMALLDLQRHVRDRDDQAGKGRGGRMEEEMSVARQAETERRDVVKHYSSLFLHMHRMSQKLEPAEIFSAVWALLKHGMKATACEIYCLKEDRLELTQAFKVAKAASTDESTGFSFEERMTRSADAIPLTECPHRIIPLASDVQTLFQFVITNKKTIFFEEIGRDPMMQALSAKNPVPVAYCYPLVDALHNTVKGLINVSQCQTTRLTDEERQVLRTTADLSAMAISHWEALEAERGAKLELKKQFSTYVSPSVVQQIMERPDLAEPRRQKVTVMFVDLRGFTNISEANPPQIVVSLLGDFFGRLTPLIFEHKGTLDKYIGDEIMALWGAPAFGPFDARRAVLAAFCMREAFAEVSAIWTPRLGRPVEIGIAINTGDAMVGSIGYVIKNYTAIGDAVNTAARLEGVTGAGRIHLTRATFEEVKDMVDGEWQAPERVQGKAEPLEIFSVTGIRKDLVEPLSGRTDEPAAPEGARIKSSRDLARHVQAATNPGQVRPGRVSSVPTAAPAAQPPQGQTPAPAGTATPGSAPTPAQRPPLPQPSNQDSTVPRGAALRTPRPGAPPATAQPAPARPSPTPRAQPTPQIVKTLVEGEPAPENPERPPAGPKPKAGGRSAFNSISGVPRSGSDDGSKTDPDKG
ncbi:MAG: hypothetical protein HY815_23720 [Candidatus Riflebacteria bacterium]|nr:hypothetical protein [Candidatus Riflebacteria bacterium]